MGRRKVKRKSIRVGIKYCGNCNPEIDSPRIVETLMRDFKGKGINFDPEISKVSDFLVILCGCQKACVNTPEWRSKGRERVVVKGQTIDFVPMNEEEITLFLKKKIKNLFLL